MPIISFQEVYRDSIQSLFGTNVPADEMVEAHPNLTKTGADSVQVSGGTFFAVMADKGRNPILENNKIFDAYRNNDGVDLSALVRSDFLVGYEPQPYDLIQGYMRYLAQKGVTQVQNFHGMNDVRLQQSVAQVCTEARNEFGLQIFPQAVICVETNKNVTIEGCVEQARALIDGGHKGIYLKCASGVIEPDFMKELTQRLAEEFPDEKIGMHVHATYGRAEAGYIAALEGAKAAEASLAEQGVDANVQIQMDVAHPALSGSTGHASMTAMHGLIEAHPDADIADNAPVLNGDAIDADTETLRKLRLKYRDFETVFDKELLQLMEAARVPGGASSTLKSIDGFVQNIGNVLGTNDWTEVQKAVYIMQAEILEDLGDPIQVTPYAANTTGQAGISLFNVLSAVNAQPELLDGLEDGAGNPASVLDKETGKVNVAGLRAIVQQHKEKFAFRSLYAGKDNQSAIVAYLCGKHGKVPETVNKNLQQQAFEMAGVEGEVDFVPAQEKAPAINALKEDIKAVSMRKTGATLWSGEPRYKPTIKDRAIKDEHALIAALTKKGTEGAVEFIRGTNVENTPVQTSWYFHGTDAQGRNKQDIIAHLGGAALVQEYVENALRLSYVDNGMYQNITQQNVVDEWREQALQNLVDINDKVAKSLDGYAADNRSLNQYARSEFMRSQISSIFQEALNNRQAGLYGATVEKIAQFRAANGLGEDLDHENYFSDQERLSERAFTQRSI